MSSRTTLNPGDLVMWTGVENAEPGVLLVAENGQDLWFQFSPKPWKYNVAQVEAFLAGGDFPEGGYLYKSYDDDTGRSFADPRMDA